MTGSNGILYHVLVRKVMAEVADCLSQCDSKQKLRIFFDHLMSDLEKLREGGFPDTYKQAVAKIDGPRSYGLQRLGFLPEKSE